MGGVGPLVNSAGPGSVHRLSRLGLSTSPDSRCCKQLRSTIPKLTATGPCPLHPLNVTHVMNSPHFSLLFCFLVLLSTQNEMWGRPGNEATKLLAWTPLWNGKHLTLVWILNAVQATDLLTN